MYKLFGSIAIITGTIYLIYRCRAVGRVKKNMDIIKKEAHCVSVVDEDRLDLPLLYVPNNTPTTAAVENDPELEIIE